MKPPSHHLKPPEAACPEPSTGGCARAWTDWRCIPSLRAIVARGLWVSALGLALLSAFGPRNATGAPAERPAELRPADAISYFLLNCVYFGRWPSDIDPQALKVARVGVLGTDTLGRNLDAVVGKATNTWFKGGTVEVVRSADPEELKRCHVVFLTTRNVTEAAQAAARFKDLPVVLVSECSEFLEKGGTIEVSIERSRLVFQLNLDRLAQSKVEMGSGLKKRAAGLLRDGRRMANPSEGESP